MYQGCRSLLHLQDRSVPAPPFDIVVARAEWRSFQDKNGEIVTPRHEQTCHYHIRLNRIRAIEPTFVSMALQVPQDILPSLSHSS